MKPIKYILEINEPNTTTVAAFTAEASTPFITISKGEIINPLGFSDSDLGRKATLQVLVVTNVEHFIWENDTNINHKICVYTKEADNTKEVRFN